ncbi:MAG: D-alanyl-D-alanine carboxypeptidase family protein [Oscillospiraceae bacterium]
MFKRMAGFAAALALIVVLGTSVNAEGIEYGFNVETRANAIYLMSLDTGEVIYEKNADTQVHPASCTKIMTAALAMEMCGDLKNTMVTVPEGVWAEFEGLNVSTAGLKVGEELSMYDLICCMMLQSGNEAASTVRDFYGGGAFIEQMNQKAAALGCVNTHFNNPHGVFADNHYSSAHDLAIITKWALDIPGFWEIAQMSRYDKAETNKNEPVTLTTTVLMQDKRSDYYQSYIKGIKTGTTDEAGRCLVSAAKQDGQSYLLVVLGGSMEGDSRVWKDGNSAFTDTKLIYDWAFENLALQNLMNEDAVIADVPLKYARQKDVLLLYPDSAVFAVVPKTLGTEYELTYETELPDAVKAPVETDQKIGNAKVMFGGRVIGEVGLISRESVPLSRFVMTMDIASDILSSRTAKIVYLVLFGILVLYLWYVLVVVQNQRKNKKRRKKSGR